MATLNQNQAARIKRQIDDLIWVYQHHRTCAGTRIEIDLSPDTLAQVLGRRLLPGQKAHPTEFEYSGHVLVCIK